MEESIKRRGHFAKVGFTLIELMLVVAILGLLAAIAIPKFANLMVKAKEAAVKGHLGVGRSVISIYYADNEGFWPRVVLPQLSAGVVSPWVDRTTAHISIPGTSHSHLTGYSCINFGMFGCTEPGDFDPAGTDYYAWYYNSHTGLLAVNCTHIDSRGIIWSTY